MGNSHHIDRRRLLRGSAGGIAAAMGLPLLDCFLNGNGTALADGAPLPVCFGTWFQGLGFLPGYWEPKQTGADYELPDQLAALAPFKKHLNIFSGMKVYLDGRPAGAHTTGPIATNLGTVPGGAEPLPPSIDSLIADVIGRDTRFRSIEVSCYGNPFSYSRRGGAVTNPSEISPASLYTRLFGAGFRHPDAADFTPDPNVMLERSVLSVVSEERRGFMRNLGSADRARLDEYFSSVRQLEHQLQLQLRKPAPLPACNVATIEKEATPGLVIDDGLANNRLFSKLLSWALACDQTRVFNLLLSDGASNFRRQGSFQTFHTYSHEEPDDPELGYPPEVKWFMDRVVEALADTLTAMASIREGDGTLLDRVLIFYSTDTGYARTHSLDNMPLMTMGGAGGRLKTGLHVSAKGDPVTRVGLTVQQAMGVPAGSWGTKSNMTSKTITEVVRA